MPNLYIKEACVIVTPSNETVHAQVGEIFTVTQEDAHILVGLNRGAVTKDAPYRLPVKEEAPKEEAPKEAPKK